MPVIEYNSWFDEEPYMDEMARMHKLSPKLDVVQLLWEEFQRLQSDTSYKPALSKEERQWFLVGLSCQILALAMELTDDVAAVCSAYTETRKANDKLFIERIANFEMGRGHEFYRRASTDPTFAAEVAGLDLSSTSNADKEAVRLRFESIKNMRDTFWNWYTGYKHGQYATPIVITFANPRGQQEQEWGLYLIPKKFQRDSAQRKVHTEDKFINTVGNVALFVNLAREAVGLWLETRNKQYPKVFQRSIP